VRNWRRRLQKLRKLLRNARPSKARCHLNRPHPTHVQLYDQVGDSSSYSKLKHVAMRCSDNISPWSHALATTVSEEGYDDGETSVRRG